MDRLGAPGGRKRQNRKNFQKLLEKLRFVLLGALLGGLLEASWGVLGPSWPVWGQPWASWGYLSRAVTTRPGILVGQPKILLRTFLGLEQRSTACPNTCCGPVPFRTLTCRPGLRRHARVRKSTGPEHKNQWPGTFARNIFPEMFLEHFFEAGSTSGTILSGTFPKSS